MEKKKIVVYVVAGAVAIYLLLRRNKSTAVASSPVSASNSDGDLTVNQEFALPYAVSPNIQGPSPAFKSTINVNVNPDVAQYLSNKYIPLFGLVGMSSSYLDASRSSNVSSAVVSFNRAAYTDVTAFAKSVFLAGGNTSAFNKVSFGA